MALTPSWPGVNNLATTTDARKNLAGLIARDAAGNARPGVFHALANAGALVTARSDMNVDIAAFAAAAVQFGGPVLIANDGVAQLPSPLVSPGAGTNYYVVYAKQNESTAPGTDLNNNRVLGTVLSTTSFALARSGGTRMDGSGTGLPAGALELATVQMPTGRTATNQAGVTISQTAPYTGLAGADIVVPFGLSSFAARIPDIVTGMKVFSTTENTLYIRVGSAWQVVWSDTTWVNLSAYWRAGFSGTLEGRRVGSDVELRCNDLTGSIPSHPTAPQDVTTALPAEWLPSANAWGTAVGASPFRVGVCLMRSTGVLSVVQDTGSAWTSTRIGIRYFAG